MTAVPGGRGGRNRMQAVVHAFRTGRVPGTLDR